MKIIGLNQVPEDRVSHNPAIKKRVMLRQGDLPHLTNFSQAQFAPGQVAQGHAHGDMAEVFFVESGQGTITINGQSYVLTPGTCVAVEPGEHHEVTNDGAEALILTYFGLRI
ncbi:MAG: cupin domain-containing protein [Leptolyngbyaceae cyanobacterium SM2_3_12]|nr:cupin domain-containing protein [Leptolyngbyaceae cyanobacterium SM2_3_12]